MIEHNICKEYPAFTPFDIDGRGFHEVIKLFKDVKGLNIKVKRATDPDRPIRRKAGDDWF